ncbi:hypothetical protein EJ05DRAFT_513033 [Pseudovirgaria hyperparasitica]|uniref:Capsule polysaccharide biosynthesis protein n=1 Tax=Pseudovirgaria hyperparasitica TaxID=470096 RepID=A0A6A6VXZ5_9PEZI|nr:uncharacterized protein EJ05DRAFT_513033 [Pseudovirgaria hyperparasitica]KAF2755528.1 hypothetical protein EJ05DRAFT_513033 [Pseudovirgaria hyperparasitica]
MASGAVLNALSATSTYILKGAGVQPLRAWRAIGVVLAILSWKNLPFVWHLRFYRALIHQLVFQNAPIPPGSLFEPAITSTRTSLWETDFNLHKSNSTYFSDLDISRTHYMVALLRTGIYASRDPAFDDGTSGPRASMALGGVSCHFKREIKPFVKYEIWTRLLSWDRKWIYLVSHIVKAGVVRPKHYTLQPGKKAKLAGKREEEESLEERKERIRGALYATSISKYVVKKGRLTIPAETVLEHSKLLPPKPADVGELAKEAQASVDTASNDATTRDDLDESFVLAEGISDFTWEKVEAERLRGLKYAEMFGKLDELHDDFDGGANGALGRYPDLF